jgi:hypothetical protein
MDEETTLHLRLMASWLPSKDRTTTATADLSARSQVYTNDAGFLAASLSQDVSKSSAIDFANVQSPTASVELEQVSPLRKTHVAGLGLSL